MIFLIKLFIISILIGSAIAITKRIKRKRKENTFRDFNLTDYQKTAKYEKSIVYTWMLVIIVIYAVIKWTYDKP
ncbi:MAG: hypothetical protein C5B52_02635 [Bacteroidetes bacterium]|nr:MAG: hypothetical protein C5B52_02635 [Bacteroidota bacterium]